MWFFGQYFHILDFWDFETTENPQKWTNNTKIGHFAWISDNICRFYIFEFWIIRKFKIWDSKRISISLGDFWQHVAKFILSVSCNKRNVLREILDEFSWQNFRDLWIKYQLQETHCSPICCQPLKMIEFVIYVSYVGMFWTMFTNSSITVLWSKCMLLGERYFIHGHLSEWYLS